MRRLAPLLVLTLAMACAEAPEPGPLTFTPSDLATPQPEAVDPVSQDDYRDRMFPYDYNLSVIGEENGGQAYLQRGVGRVAFDEDLTEAVVTVEEGVEPVTVFRREPRGNFFDCEAATFGDCDIAAGLLLVPSAASGWFFASGNTFSIDGLLGFATPVPPDPADGPRTYRNEVLVQPQLTLVVEGGGLPQGFVAFLPGMALTLDPATGEVTGELFEGRNTVDYDGDARSDDNVSIVATLENGRLDGTEVRGDVRFAATLDRNRSGEIVDLELTVTSDDVRGRLFGDRGQALGVVYSGEGTVLGPDGPVPLVFGGFAVGQP